MSQKHENSRFSTCLILLRSYSIYLGAQLNQVSPCLGNFILPFARKHLTSLLTTVVQFCSFSLTVRLLLPDQIVLALKL